MIGVCPNYSIVWCVVWLGSLRDQFKCRETSSSALQAWFLVAWASRQADGTQISGSGHCWRVAPGGREGPARRNGTAETLMARWRLAVRGRCARRWWQVVPGGRTESARRWRCRDDSAGVWRLGVRVPRQAMTMQWWFCRRMAPGGTCPPPGGDGAVMILRARGVWWRVMPARRSKPSVCLATWDARQAVLVQWWCARKGFYTAL